MPKANEDAVPAGWMTRHPPIAATWQRNSRFRIRCPICLKSRSIPAATIGNETRCRACRAAIMPSPMLLARTPVWERFVGEDRRALGQSDLVGVNWAQRADLENRFPGLAGSRDGDRLLFASVDLANWTRKRVGYFRPLGAAFWLHLNGPLRKCFVHNSRVCCIAFSPDGRFLAAGTCTGAVHVWDVESGLLKVLYWENEDEESVDQLKYSTCGRFLGVVSSSDSKRSLRMRNARTFETVYTIPGVDGFTFSPDGIHLVVSRENEVFLCDVEGEGDQGTLLVRFSSLVGGFEFSPNGKNLVISGYDGSLAIFDVESGALYRSVNTTSEDFDGSLFTFPSDREQAAVIRWIDRIGFSPDGEFIAVGIAPTAELQCWSIASGWRLWSLQGGGENVAVSPDGKVVFAIDTHGKANLIAFDTGHLHEQLGQMGVREAARHPGSFSPDGNVIASSGMASSIVQVWDVSRKRVAATGPETPHKSAVYTIEFGPTGEYAATVDIECGDILLWELPRSVAPKSKNVGHHQGATCLAFSQDGEYLASGGVSGTVKLWPLKSDSSASEDAIKGLGCVQRVSFSAGGKLVAVDRDGARITSYNTQNKEVWQEELKQPDDKEWTTRILTNFESRLKFTAPTGEMPSCHFEAAAFSRDGRTVAGVCEYGFLLRCVLLWNVSDGCLRPLQKSDQFNWDAVITISPNGRVVATATAEGDVSLWSVQSGRHRKTLASPGQTMQNLCFSGEGRLMIGQTGLGICVWEVATGELIAYAGLANPTGLAATAYGRPVIAVGSGDGNVWFFRLPVRRESDN